MSAKGEGGLRPTNALVQNLFGQIDLDPDTESFLKEGKRLAWWRPASDESVRTVLAADPASDDGRSEWLWIRLANGDLILGVFPQGDTYFATEEDHSA